MNAFAEQPWRLDGVLGVGALATVYRAVAPSGLTCAAKVLHRSGSVVAEEGLRAEAQLLARLHHPNVVEVFGTVIVEGRTALLMELVDGKTLEVLIAEAGTMPEDRIRVLGRQIAAGLAAAHAEGIVHRDLKPANILVASDGGVAKVADFGLARLAALADAEPVAATSLVGTPATMAPEAIDPLAVDSRSDLYALGCVLFEMAMGRPPFEGPTAIAVLEQHRNAPAPAVAGCSDDLARIIAKLLAKSPLDRFQSAAAVVRALTSADSAPLADTASRLAGGRTTCEGCGHPVPVGLSSCLRCGVARPFVAAGRSLVIIAPRTAKQTRLDPVTRQRVLDWVRVHPELQLETKRLEKEPPAFPLVLCRGLSEASAESLSRSLRAVNVDAAARHGFALRNGALRRAAVAAPLASSGMRVIGFGVVLSLLLHASEGTVTVAAVLFSMALLSVVAVATVGLSMRPVLTSMRRPPQLSAGRHDGLAHAVAALPAVVGSLRHDRHKDALAGVAGQVVALREVMLQTDARPDASAVEVELELRRALDIAIAATAELDALDSRLVESAAGSAARTATDSAAEGSSGNSAVALHRERTTRDLWSTRLLQLCATLESLRIRLSSAEHRRNIGQREDDELEALRLHIEALEELQST